MAESDRTPLLHESSDSDAHSIGADTILQTLSDYFNDFPLSDDGVPWDDPATEFASNGYGDVSSQMVRRASEEALAARDDEGVESVHEESLRRLVMSIPASRVRSERQPVAPHNRLGLVKWIRFIFVALVLASWSFVCLILGFGVPELGMTRIGLGCSLLIQPNRLFVESIYVAQSGTNSGPILYGFHNEPPLDVISTWSDTHFASLDAHMHKDWVYVLNEGSQINISYSIPSSSSFLLTITRGGDDYGQSLYDQLFPNSTLSWHIIHGNGLIQQNIIKSGGYHIAVGNLNSEGEEVQLNISARAFVYNTSNAYYTCTLSGGQCAIPVLLLEANRAVLTTPRLKQGTSDREWHVKLAYGLRWSVYFGGLVVINAMMLVGFHLFTTYGTMRWSSNMDDNRSIQGSSYESLPEDSDNPSNNIGRLCAICRDAPKDCFFLPCAHSVACFACGTRIKETTGTCPVCQRRMKKPKKIYTS